MISSGTMIIWGGGAGEYVSASANGFGTIAVPGWLYCDGNTVLKTAYSSLYAAIGDRYNVGGEGATVFRLPGYNQTMWQYTNTSSNIEYTLSSTSHSHNLTGDPTINALSNSVHNHNVTPLANITSNGGHQHGAWGATILPAQGNRTQLTTGGTGSAQTATTNHTHSASPSAVVFNSETHSHTMPIVNIISNTHNHTSPTISSSKTAGSTAHAQPTIHVWHIIKI